MAAALQAQGRRVELLKKRFEMVEKDYMRKMSEMEKNLYKSPLV
jgi:DNA-binding ferritin-like protein (Dps family)